MKFKIEERIYPSNLILLRKYYAKIINGDDISFDELVELISKASSLNYDEVSGT